MEGELILILSPDSCLDLAVIITIGMCLCYSPSSQDSEWALLELFGSRCERRDDAPSELEDSPLLIHVFHSISYKVFLVKADDI